MSDDLNSKAIEIIDGAIERLKRGWTRGKYARNRRGVSVPISDPSACRFCSLGAILAAAGVGRFSDDHPPHVTKAIDVVRQVVSPWDITLWNDDLRPADKPIVLATFAKARAILIGEAAQ